MGPLSRPLQPDGGGREDIRVHLEPTVLALLPVAQSQRAASGALPRLSLAGPGSSGPRGSMVRHALSVGTDCSVLKSCLSLYLASFPIAVEVLILHRLRPLL